MTGVSWWQWWVDSLQRSRTKTTDKTNPLFLDCYVRRDDDHYTPSATWCWTTCSIYRAEDERCTWTAFELRHAAALLGRSVIYKAERRTVSPSSDAFQAPFASHMGYNDLHHALLCRKLVYEYAH